MMHPDVQLKLEALKMLQQWSIWLITIASAFFGIASFAFRDARGNAPSVSAKLCIAFMFLTVVLAVTLVGAIPAIVQKLQAGIGDHRAVLGLGNARGVYGELYLDVVPLWVLVSSQRIFFLLGLFFGARLLWLRGTAS
jgi:hypothetical protein